MTTPNEPNAHALSLRDHIEAVLPSETRARRVAEWGVVAWALVGVGVIGWILWVLLHRLAGVVPYLVVAGLVVLVLSPAVRGLMRLRVPREVAATAVFLAAAAATPALVPLMVRTLLAQLKSLLESSPESLGHGGIVTRLSHSSNSMIRKGAVAVEHWVRVHQHDAGKILGDVGVTLAHIGVVLLLGSLLGYLILLSRPGLSAGLMLIVPPGRRQTVTEVMDEMGRIVAGFVRARLIVSAVVGVITTIGLWAIGMPAWLLLGFLVGVANLVPTLGSFIGGAPVVLVALLTKPPAFVFAAVAVMVVAHAVDGYVLSPIILKETVGLPPVVVLLSVVIGAELMGIIGIFAAIPVAGIIQYALKRWVAPKVYGPPDDEVPIPAGNLPLAEGR
jgi:predicted PurR-regulated permease PerM